MKFNITTGKKFGVILMRVFFLFTLFMSNASGETLDDCGFPIVEFPTTCTPCHGAPPATSTHPTNSRCFRCHGQVVNDAYQIINNDLHKNGTVNYAVGCTSCHGWNLGASPPQNLSGECSRDASGVALHAAHRRNSIPAHQTNCSNCHKIPLTTEETGHIDGDGVVEVQFDKLATANGATPTWNGSTCSSTYCHGATLSGGSLKNPSWTDYSGAAKKCGACHTAGASDCSSCHPTSVGPNHKILYRGTHINGVIDTVLP